MLCNSVLKVELGSLLTHLSVRWAAASWLWKLTWVWEKALLLGSLGRCWEQLVGLAGDSLVLAQKDTGLHSVSETLRLKHSPVAFPH